MRNTFLGVSSSGRSHPFAFLAGGLAGIAMLLYVAALVITARLPMVIDPTELGVISVAWLATHGQPMYTALDAAGRYSLLYGPVCYWLYGAVLALSPTLTALKLAVVALHGATLAVLWITFRRLLPALPAFCCLAAIVSALMLRQILAFMIRGDVELIFLIALTLLAIELQPGWLAALLFGLGGGLACDVKLTAVFYLVAPLVLFSRRHGKRTGIVALVAALLAAGLPFADRGVSLPHYLDWLHVAALHPYSLRLIGVNLALAAVMLAPLAWLWGGLGGWSWQTAQHYLSSHPPLLAALFLGLAGSCITGSKIGAGRNHLLPHLLIAAYLAALLWKRYPPSRSTALLAGLIGYGFVLVALQGFQLRQLWQICVPRRAYALSLVHEVEQIQANDAGQTIELGYGTSPDRLQPIDSVSLVSPSLILAGNPVTVDVAALSDMELAGIDALPTATLSRLRSCSTELWLLPRGQQPFTVTNPYVPDIPSRFPDPHLFSPAFRQAFSASYTKVSSTAHFDLYRCHTR